MSLIEEDNSRDGADTLSDDQQVLTEDTSKDTSDKTDQSNSSNEKDSPEAPFNEPMGSAIAGPSAPSNQQVAGKDF